MKGFLKFLGGLLLIPYILIVIVVTICLLGYNDYNITELGDYTLIPVNDDGLSTNYQKGDLLVIKKTKPQNINTSDYIFFYETNAKENTVNINLAKVENSEKVTDKEYTYTVDGDAKFSSEYVIGTVKDCKAYNGLGTILSLLESKWIFLLVIILPILFIFLYEIYAFIIEVKKNLK